MVKIVVELVSPDVRGGGGFGVSGYLHGRYEDGFQGHAELEGALDHAIQCLQRYKKQLGKKDKNERGK